MRKESLRKLGWRRREANSSPSWRGGERNAEMERERNTLIAEMERRGTNTTRIQGSTEELAQLSLEKEAVQRERDTARQEAETAKRQLKATILKNRELNMRAKEHYDAIRKVNGPEGELKVGERKWVKIPKDGFFFAVPFCCTKVSEKSTMVYSGILPDTPLIRHTFKTTSKVYQTGKGAFGTNQRTTTPNSTSTTRHRIRGKQALG